MCTRDLCRVYVCACDVLCLYGVCVCVRAMSWSCMHASAHVRNEHLHLHLGTWVRRPIVLKTLGEKHQARLIRRFPSRSAGLGSAATAS